MALTELLLQFCRREGRRAWAADLAEVPRVLRWVLPWAALGATRRNANPVRWLLACAKRHPEKIALRSPGGEVSFGLLVAQTAAKAAAFAEQGLVAGQRVALISASNSELVTSLLACFWLGAIACLFDEDTPSGVLETQLERLHPDYVVCCAGARKEAIAQYRALRVHGDGGKRPEFGAPEVSCIAARDTGMILPTSGTEGDPKLCKVKLGRLMLAGHAFGGLLLRLRPSSVIYCPLPLTHATAIMAGLMPAIVHGCTLHLAGKFSAERFFGDLGAAGATHVLYVGDLLRFVVAKAKERPNSAQSIERWVGNGLDETTWGSIQELVPRARIVEFYGATELPALIVNLSGHAGSMGRVPFRAWSRFCVVRGLTARGCVGNGAGQGVTPCGPGEPGELLIAMSKRARTWVGAFEGYVSQEHEKRAFLRNVFVRGDAYYRTGDVVCFDRNDFFYFVDRVGDVIRTRGYNVSTSWIAQQLRQVDGVENCLVVPVALDESNQRVALAVLVTLGGFNLESLAARLSEMPKHTRPGMIQLAAVLPSTNSFKTARNTYRRDIYSPLDSGSVTYFWDGRFHAVDSHSWPSIRARLLALKDQ